MSLDIPSPINLKESAAAESWADTAMIKRPWRVDFFQAISATIIKSHPSSTVRILELGSGPGFLAEYLLQSLPDCQYVALDFSQAMHRIAQKRTESYRGNIQFLERDFLHADWSEDLGKFDIVVTMQAIHELRHKTRAPALHKQVKALLHNHGHYLVCDHDTGIDGMQNTELYMSVLEQKTALLSAGFSNVELILKKQGLALHQAGFRPLPV